MIMKHPLYRSFMMLLTEILGGQDLPFRKRLAHFLLGIFAAKTIVFSNIADELSTLNANSTKSESYERALRRTLSDSRLSWNIVYRPLLKKILSFEELEGEKKCPVYLLIDETCRKGDFRILVAAIACQGRAIPIAWEVWRGQEKRKEKGFYWKRVSKLLKKVRRVLPPNLQVIVIGDRAFGVPPFVDLVLKQGWDWLARLQKQTCFVRQDSCKQLSEILPSVGFYRAYGELFKKAGWRKASLVCKWKRKYKGAMFLGSSLPLTWDLIALYRKRALIECLFRDWKSSGWQWESSQVQDFYHHKRQILMMAIATLLALCRGQEQALILLNESSSHRRTRPFEAKKSLFQMGLQGIRTSLYQSSKPPSQWVLYISSEQNNWSEELHHYRAHIEPIKK